MKVAIIGAGAAGLCSAHFITKEFSDAEVVIFDATDYVGGTWNYTDATRDEEFDLPVMTSMYKNLRTNLPKEVMSFSDYPIPEESRTFMSDEEYLAYLHRYAKHFDLVKLIKFRHLVTSVKAMEKGWEVAYRDLRGEKNPAQMFDYVYVCNGHYNRAFIPEYKGQDLFEGLQIHSHDYRKPEHFKDKSVLIIGAGPSAQDISIDVARECKSLFLSHHSRRLPSPYPPHFQQRPDVREFNSTAVVFVDGTCEEIDVVMYCTGYAYYCPFLDSSCGLTVERTHIRPLHRHIVNIEHPTMFFIGIPQLCCAIPLMDMQVRYTIAALKGSFTLPSKEEMMSLLWKEKEERKALGGKKQDTHLLGPLEAFYYEELAKESGVVAVPRVFSDIRQSTMQTKVNLYVYRNYQYKILDANTFVATYEGEDNQTLSDKK